MILYRRVGVYEVLARGGREETEEEGSVVVLVVAAFDAVAEEGEVEMKTVVVVEGVVAVTGGAGVASTSS